VEVPVSELTEEFDFVPQELNPLIDSELWNEHNRITKSTSGFSENCLFSSERAGERTQLRYSFFDTATPLSILFPLRLFFNDLTLSFQPVLKLISENTILLSGKPYILQKARQKLTHLWFL
jgi:hypothetical protein